jgi:hypothetical protein
MKANSLNPQIKEQYLIQVVQICPFTNNEQITKIKGVVVDFIKIQNSKSNLSFCYVNNYGLDCYVSFEEVEIIEKIKVKNG